MKLQEKLQELTVNRQAILAVNYYNFETLSGIMQAAKNTGEPIILQVSESTLNYLGVEIAVALARTSLSIYGVTGWLHLDHGSSVNTVSRCLDAGFDSVMIDASEKPFEVNVKMTTEVVKLAAKYKVNVEAELGYVAKLGQSQDASGFTQPGEAKTFVDLTGVNALAVSIGSAHGFYKSTPRLQIGLLKQIRDATPVALVLHGSSGIPDEMIRDAIRNGISKVNLATETKNIFMKSLQKELLGSREIDLRKVFPVATSAVTDLIEQKLNAIKKI